MLRALPWLGAGLAASLPLLLATPRREAFLLVATVHLSALVVFGLAMAFDLAPLADEEGWFQGSPWPALGKRVAAGASVVALVTGVVALVTLASSAALRLAPSLQFLQLLSSLDIAWAGAALIVGVRRMLGRPAALVGGTVLGVVCVWAIWRYLAEVGFTPQGGWIVSGPALWRYVLPYDVGAALVAAAVLVAGARRPARPPVRRS